MYISKEKCRELATSQYTIEGLSAVYDMGDWGKRVDYVAKDEKDLDNWLILQGRLMAEKYEDNFRGD